MRKARLLLVLALALAPPAYAGDLALAIGGHAIKAEIAGTPGTRARGLMGRTQLCADCGMLFIFSAPARHGFWMKNTPLRLAIAFIGNDGRIIDIKEMRPDTLNVHYPRREALYALEMNGGWFAAHGIRTGDRVDGLPQGRAAAEGMRGE